MKTLLLFISLVLITPQLQATIDVSPISGTKKIAITLSELSSHAKIELLRDIHSEYFILNQFAFYEFGWSLPVKNAYGYQFDNSFFIYRFVTDNPDEINTFR